MRKSFTKKDVQLPKSIAWAWNEALDELINVRPTDQPGSLSASSGASKTKDNKNREAKRRRRECLRSIGEIWGPLDREKWAREGSDPVQLEDCVRVALHYVAEEVFLPNSFIRVMKREQVQELLYCLINYFFVLFGLCDQMNKVTPPTVEDTNSLKMKWEDVLTRAMESIVPAYTALLMTDQKQQGTSRGIKGSIRLRSHQFELLYQVVETLVWLVMMRRDRELVNAEVTRLFKGKLGVYYQQGKYERRRSSASEDHDDMNSLNDFSVEDSTLTDVVHPGEKEAKQCKDSSDKIQHLFQEASGIMKRQPPDISLRKLCSEEQTDFVPYEYCERVSHTRCFGQGVMGCLKECLTETLSPAVRN